MITYDTHVLPYKNQYQKVIIPEEKVLKIRDFVTDLIKVKEKENHHLKDNRSHFKRYFTGMLGEAALEEFLGVTSIIDWSIGESKNFHKPDLQSLGIKAGIKTVEYGLFPVIFKKSYSPEIIMIKVSNHHIVICGLATSHILDKYQSIELIKDSKLRARGTKTGFYGFQHLKTFYDIQSLKEAINS
ncbi:hypothetical protein [Bacillus sp. JCM 19034]|uniref:hypothetical protein n=1 Tax=Bacillus sp. JCM 19034 TaxID=1481928 RepID=UPI0007829418|nr:hypothetical protein [Bacillus sp. JCM 19034]